MYSCSQKLDMDKNVMAILGMMISLMCSFSGEERLYNKNWCTTINSFMNSEINTGTKILALIFL